MKKSRVYKLGKKLFRYDYDHCVVEYVTKPTAEELADNERWQRDYGHDLWDIDQGYIVVETIGLRLENWKDREARDEYLNEWIFEMDEYCACELAYLI